MTYLVTIDDDDEQEEQEQGLEQGQEQRQDDDDDESRDLSSDPISVMMPDAASILNGPCTKRPPTPRHRYIIISQYNVRIH